MPTFFLMHIPQDRKLTEQIAHELNSISSLDVILNEEGDLATIGAIIPTSDVIGIVLTHQALCTAEIHAGLTAARTQKKRIILILAETLDKQLLHREWEDFDFEKSAQQNWKLLQRGEWIDFRNKREFFRKVQKLASRLTANFLKRYGYRKFGWKPQQAQPAVRMVLGFSLFLVIIAVIVAIWAVAEADAALDDRHASQQKLADIQTAQAETYAPLATQLTGQNSLYEQTGDLQLTQQALYTQNEDAIKRGNTLQSILWVNFAQQNLTSGNVEVALPLAVASYRFDMPPLPESVDMLNLLANHPLPQFNGVQPPHADHSMWSISADAGFVGLAHNDQIHIWKVSDLSTPPQTYTFNNSVTITEISFSADNQYVLIHTEDNQLAVINTATAELVQSWQAEATIHRALFMPHSQSIVTAETAPDGESAVVLRNIQSGEIEKRIPRRTNLAITRLAIHPDNDWFMLAYEDGGFAMGQLENDELPESTSLSPGSFVSSLAFSTDGHYGLRTECSRTETTCRLIRHDFINYSETLLTILDFPVDTINIASAWQTAYVAGCDQICQFAQVDLISGETQLVGLETWDTISHIGINTVQHEVISVSDHYGLIRWETLSQPYHYQLRDAAVIELSPDGKTIVTAQENGSLATYDAQTGSYLQELSSNAADVTRIAFAPDGSRMVTISRTEPLKLWDMLTHEFIHSLEVYPSPITHVAMSEDHRAMLGTAENGDLIVWDTTTGAIVDSRSAHTDSIQSVAISNDHNWGITTTVAGDVYLWDLVSQTLMRHIHVPQLTDIQFVPGDWAFVTVNRSGHVTWRSVQAEGATLTQDLNQIGDWQISFMTEGRNIVFYAEEGAQIWDVSHDVVYPSAVNIPQIDDIRRLTFATKQNRLWILDGNNQAYWWIIQLPEDLIEQIYASTTIRELTCYERQRYHFEPGCIDSIYPTRTPYRATASHTPTLTPSPTITPSPTNDPSIPSHTPSPTATLFEIPTVTIAPSYTPSTTPTPSPTETLPVISAFALE